LSEFLSAVNQWFDLAVWSSASAAYVNGVVANLFGEAFPLRFVWSRERCTRRFDLEHQDYFYAKKLVKACKLGYPLERMLIVDDSPEKIFQNYGNHIHIRPFRGSPTDTELRDLLPFLEWLREMDNIRGVEKRYWRSFRPARPPAP
jgi:RNA polymerase II subunit A small phosphatase-like protein